MYRRRHTDSTAAAAIVTQSRSTSIFYQSGSPRPSGPTLHRNPSSFSAPDPPVKSPDLLWSPHFEPRAVGPRKNQGLLNPYPCTSLSTLGLTVTRACGPSPEVGKVHVSLPGVYTYLHCPDLVPCISQNVKDRAGVPETNLTKIEGKTKQTLVRISSVEVVH